MMNYDEFVERFKKEFSNYFQEEVKIQFDTMKSNDVNLDIVYVDDEKNTPTLYMKEVYGLYKHIGSFEKVCGIVSSSMMKVLKQNLPNFLEDGSARNKIVCSLVNKDFNKELLDTIPHIPFLDDMIIVFEFHDDNNPNDRIMVTSAVMERLGLEINSLFQLAIWNTRQLREPYIMTVSEAAQGVIKANAVAVMGNLPENILEKLMESVEESVRKYDLDTVVITNHHRNFGATSLLFVDVVKEAAERLDSDLLLCPFCTDFVMAISDTEDNLNNITKRVDEMIKEIDTPRHLSKNVYRYLRTTNSYSRISL